MGKLANGQMGIAGEDVRRMIEELEQAKEKYVREVNAEVNRQVGIFDGRIAALRDVLALMEGEDVKRKA